MSQRSRLKNYLSLAALCAGGALLGGQPAQAQTLRATFDLTGVTFVIQKLGGQPYFFSTPVVESGQFLWQYAAGDFAGGTGSLLSLQFPITPDTPGGVDTVTLDGISGTLPTGVNLDNLSYDYAITFAPALTGPDQSTHVTGGTFDLTGTDGFSSGEFTGIVTGGSVVPAAAPEPGSGAGVLVGLGLLGVAAARHQKSARSENPS